jgi:hypothetical protein
MKCIVKIDAEEFVQQNKTAKLQNNKNSIKGIVSRDGG